MRRARTQRGDRQARRVVDIERQILQLARGVGEALEFGHADMPGAQFLRHDLGPLGKNTPGELVGRHFEAEKSDRRADRLVLGNTRFHVTHPAPGGIECDVGRERGLAHAGTAGEDQQIRTVEAAGRGVEVGQAGGDARDAAARILGALRSLHRHRRGANERLHAALAAALLGDLVELQFGDFDLLERIDVLAGVERSLHQPAADADQRAQHREIVDLVGKGARADQVRRIGGELREIGRSAQFGHRRVLREHRAERHRRGEAVVAHQHLDRAIDAPMQRLEEMLGPELGHHVFGDAIVDHHCTEQRGLRLHVGRQCVPRFGLVGSKTDRLDHIVPHSRKGARFAITRACGKRE